jgi:hypothetical protein
MVLKGMINPNATIPPSICRMCGVVYLFRTGQKVNQTMTRGLNVHETMARRLKEHANISEHHLTGAHLFASDAIQVSLTAS